MVLGMGALLGYLEPACKVVKTEAGQLSDVIFSHCNAVVLSAAAALVGPCLGSSQ